MKGDKQRSKDYWNHDTLKDFVEELSIPLRM
jgi:hypothetical protein